MLMPALLTAMSSCPCWDATCGHSLAHAQRVGDVELNVPSRCHRVRRSPRNGGSAVRIDVGYHHMGASHRQVSVRRPRRSPVAAPVTRATRGQLTSVGCTLGPDSVSMIVAFAMPPDSHIVQSPYRPPVSSRRPTQLGKQPPSRSPHRVAERDCAAPRIDHAPRSTGKLGLPCEHDGCERLVHLDGVHVLHRQSRPLQHLLRRRDDAGQHQDGIIAHGTRRHDTRPRREPMLASAHARRPRGSKLRHR